MESFTSLITAHPFLISLTLIPFYFVFSTLHSYTRLSHIPGPRLAALSNLFMIRTGSSTRLATIFIDLAKTYGPLVRVGPNTILTSNIALLRKTGAVRGTYTRDDWYLAFRFQPWTDNVFNMRDISIHDKRKGMVAIGYNISGREVDLIEPSVDEQIATTVELLREKYVVGEGRLLDFAALASYLTMDVITRAAFGREFGHLKEDRDVTGYLTQLRKLWPIISVVTEWPALRSLIYSKWYLWAFGPKSTDETGMGKVLGVVAQVVEERFRGRSKPEGRKDMLDSWIHHGLTQAECEAEGLLALAAGSETAATTMRMTLLSLMTNPTAYRKLKEETQKAVQSGLVSEPITFAEAKELPYLTAVVLEGMRMRPPTVGGFSKVVPSQGESVDGEFIPGGTVIAANIPAIMQDEAVFGSEPSIFLPERWLNATEEKRVEMVQVMELIFGTGRWMCAGKPIAYMELCKTFFELFRHFDFGLANAVTPLDSKCYNVYIEENMWVRVTEESTGT